MQDAVARRFKLCFLYKRPGQRVLINRRGDMLVRPTFIELTLNQTPFNASVHDVRASPFLRSLAVRKRLLLSASQCILWCSNCDEGSVDAQWCTA